MENLLLSPNLLCFFFVECRVAFNLLFISFEVCCCCVSYGGSFVAVSSVRVLFLFLFIYFRKTLLLY